MAVLQLLNPTRSTTTKMTGGYVDLRGYIGPGHREIKFVLEAGAGTTAGTCGGSVQSASTTAGAGLATVGTFTTLTAAGGKSEVNAVVAAGHRFVRVIGTIQTAKFMNLSAIAVARDMLV
jgi:hypothetical protein